MIQGTQKPRFSKRERGFLLWESQNSKSLQDTKQEALLEIKKACG
jgi:hypothetical protein